MDLEDKNELIRKVAAGDEIAFRRLFEIFHPNIYTTALRITHDVTMSEDIVQDTFLKVWLQKNELASIHNFEGWLYTIAKNITLNILKKGKFYKEYLQEEGSRSINQIYPGADYNVQDKDFLNLLEEAIKRLPPKQQETYRLIKEQFLKRNEAAELLQVSPETVKWNLDQAMKSIRAYCLSNMGKMPLILLLHFFSKYF